MCNSGVWGNKQTFASCRQLSRQVSCWQCNYLSLRLQRNWVSLCLQLLLTRVQLSVSHLCYSHHVTMWTNGTCRYWKESLSTLNLPVTSSQSWSQVTSCSLVSMHSKRTAFHSLYGLKIWMKILLGEYCSCRNPRYASLVGSMLCKLKCVFCDEWLYLRKRK